jgi:hypothetical protein
MRSAISALVLGIVLAVHGSVAAQSVVCFDHDPVCGTAFECLGRLVGVGCTLLGVDGVCSLQVPPCCGCVQNKSFKCLPCKLKAASKRFDCLAKGQVKALKGGLGTYEQFRQDCDAKFTEVFQKCEAKAGPGGCLTAGDAAAVGAMVDADADELLGKLQGGSASGAFVSALE